MLMEAAAWPGPSGLREAAEREEGSTPRPPLRERPTARCGCGARFLSLHGWWVHSSSRPEPGPGSRLLRDIRFLTGRSAGRAAPRPSRPSRGGRTVRHTEPRPWGQGGAGPDTARPPGAAVGGLQEGQPAAHAALRAPEDTRGGAAAVLPGPDAAAASRAACPCHGACCVTRAPSPRVPEPRPGARPRRLTARVPEVTCSSGQPDSPQGGAPRLQEPVGQTTVYQ